MNKLVVALSALVLASGVVAGQLWSELRDVRTQSAQLQERVNTLDTAAPAMATSPASLSGSGTTAAQTPASVQPAESSPASAAPAVQAGASAVTAANATKAAPANSQANAMTEGISKILSSEAGRDMVQAQLRMSMPRLYPDLAKELGLSKAEEDKFLDLLARQQAQVSALSLEYLGAAQADRGGAQEMQRKMMELQQANDAESKALLGDKQAQWQQYQDTLPIRRQVGALQSSLGAANALSDSQAKSVIAAMSAEQSRINEERRLAIRQPGGAAAAVAQNNVEAQLQRQADEASRMVDAAASYLNAQQLETFHKTIDQQQELARTVIRSVAPPKQ